MSLRREWRTRRDARVRETHRANDGDIVYSTSRRLDFTNAVEVLALLLAKEEAFGLAEDSREAREATYALIRSAKREVLTTWYKHHVETGAARCVR